MKATLIRLAQNSAWLLLSRLWAQIASAVFTILVARHLGGNNFGEYAFMAALIVTGNLVTTFGTDLFLIRAIAADGRMNQLPAALVLQLLLSTLFVAGIYLVAPRFTFLSAGGVDAVRIYILSLFPLAFFTVFSSALRGSQAMVTYAAINFLLASMQILAASVFYWTGGNLTSLAGLLLLVQGIGALTAGILCTMDIPGFWQAWRFSWTKVLLLVKDCSSLALLSVTGVLYQRLPLILLPFLLGAFPAGIFAIAVRMVEMAKIGHVAAFTALYPLMAQNKSGNMDQNRSYRLSWLILLSVAGLESLILFITAPLLVDGLMGPGYADSIPALKILAWTLLPYTTSTFLGLAYLSRGDGNTVMMALATALLVQTVLVVWWSPAGPAGTAGAVLVSETLQAIILSFQAARQHYWLWPASRGANELPGLS